MEILTLCADWYSKKLKDSVMEKFPKSDSQSMDSNTQKEITTSYYNRQVGDFNLCTAGLIASVALGILGIFSARATLLVGGCCLFGRQVVHRSFSGELSSYLPKFFSNRLKPEANYTFNGVVIFYKEKTSPN